MRLAQPIGVADSEVSTMLCPNAQTGLSSSLMVAPLTTLPGESDGYSVMRDHGGLPKPLNGRMEDLRGWTASLTPSVFHDSGELVDENEIVTSYRKGWAEFSIQGHHPSKDGIPSGWLATETFATGSASLSGQAALQLWKLAFKAKQI